MDSPHTHPRVVVTGLGAVTPLGLNVDTTWQNLLRGVSGASLISRFDTTGFAVRIANEVKDFDPMAYPDVIDRKEARRFDRIIQLTLVAAAEAIRQSGLKVTADNTDEIGVVIGTGIGGLGAVQEAADTLHSKGPMRVSPYTATNMLPNMPAGQVAITFGLRGINYCLISACATGSHAIGEAFEIIRRGDAQVMVAGGAEAPLTPIGLAAFHRTGAMSTRNDDPQRASRPFDKDRDGFVMAEGASLLVLENLESARARGATILAEIVGYGATDDAYHASAPAEGGVGAIKCMQRALKKAGLQPGDIDYINAHGTSTTLNDKGETQAIKAVFGDLAYQVPISSTKSMLGHLLGAAGAVEGVVSVKTILEGKIHPTINLMTPDPDCDLNYTPNGTIERNVDVVLSNSFGFGGHNATVIFKKYAS
ncbi:MAG: beta-ketoacyl-ACP synthase II [Chloroflexi bacterium]|nr:beta-ketoacyl-ACP synthase II [Chloroflexota bacterium]